VYLSGHRAVASAAAVAVSPLTCETHAVYSSFDALLKDAGVAWRDLVRVRQFVTDPAADFNHVREGRIQYVPPGAFTSTSICCDPGDPSGRPARPWLIAAELEAAVGTKISLNTSALVQTPATAHALKVGNLVHLQAEISDDETGRILFKDDIEAQARHVLQKMDLLLAAAERRWDDIVTSRVFCKISEHLKRVREIERFWAGDASYARCDAVSKFFDPDVLVEVELTVAR
jgi:enamine deaminase RidA (YjgF/YER057c/UK114 family)